MTSILLINDNKIVSRLLQLSSEKNGYNLQEVTDISGVDGSYDVVFVDSENYSDELLNEITTNIKYTKLGYIGNKQENSPNGFDLIIEKPFLPTDFVEMMKEQVIGSAPSTTENEKPVELEKLDLDTETDLLLSEDTLDLDYLDDEMEELLLDEDLELEEDLSLDDLNKELSTEDTPQEVAEVPDDFDLSLNSAAVMTTGIAASMVANENAPEELADMVSELDNMEDELELADEPDELSLELEEEIKTNSKELAEDASKLDEEVSALEDDLELQEVASIEEPEVSKQELDEVPELEEESLEEVATLEEDIASLDTDDEIEEPSVELEEDIAKEDADDESLLEDIATGVGVAAVGAAAVAMSTEESTKEESSELNDFDNLTESDMQTALGEEVVEEIISQEIVTDGEIKEEGLVEMDDMQAWIRDAVQKAITPQMIQNALSGMDININLTFNAKNEDNTPS